MRTIPATIMMACLGGAIVTGCDNYGNDFDQPTESGNRDTTVMPDETGRDTPYAEPGDSPRFDPNTPPDNTGINQRDRENSTVLPTDQGGAESDIEMTQAIRQRITGMDDLSMNARNIKIITLNGQVTLRGPVSSEDERNRIVVIARELAGADRVVNELEVINP